MHGTIWNGLRFALTILSGNILYSFAFVAACGPLQTHFHREGSYRKAAATTVDIPSRWDLQQRRPLPAAETGRSCWGSGQQDARPLQGPLQTLSAATRDIKKEPTGLFFAACRRPCSFDSSYGLHEKIPDPKIRDFIHDPYGNRTHVTAVKGPCLNRLTNGPYKYRASLKPPTSFIHYCR